MSYSRRDLPNDFDAHVVEVIKAARAACRRARQTVDETEALLRQSKSALSASATETAPPAIASLWLAQPAVQNGVAD